MDQQQLHTALLAHMYNNKLTGANVATTARLQARQVSDFIMFGSYDFKLGEMVRLALSVGVVPKITLETEEE
jgi:predicted XRE-type DNA-binding protein